MTDYIYDSEIYPNVYLVTFGNTKTRKSYVFEISERKDDREKLLSFLRIMYQNKDRLVGFNNVGFDYPLLHYIIKNPKCTVGDIYSRAEDIIRSNNDEDKKFSFRISEKDTLIPQIDLYMIHHFDNKARATSLKVLEFNMLSDDIEDLPYVPGSRLTDGEIEVLKKYNKHDVLQTFLFYERSLNNIAFRESLSEKYQRNFMNHNDTKIGKDYFIMELEKAGVKCFDSQRRPIQTKRDSIALKDCIFPYVSFNRPEFEAVRKWLAQQTITETKGVFTNILECDLGDVAKYANMKEKKLKLSDPYDKKNKRYVPSSETIAQIANEYPGGWLVEKEVKSPKGAKNYYWHWNVAENLNVVVDGLEYVFGTGGIHAAQQAKIFVSNEQKVIKSYDFSSYYPNLCIRNRIYPEHLGEEFCDIYEDVYVQRKTYAKGTPENAAMKLALNGTYGDSNSEYSPFYDPMFTMKITINGQLTLCMLVERLKEIDSVEIIMVNTDGLEFIVDREHTEEVERICKEFETFTKIPLESSEYVKLCINNVNNYIGVQA